MNEFDLHFSSYWFGRRAERLFLYDGSLQPSQTEDVFLWEIKPQAMRFFKKHLIRPTLVAFTPEATIQSDILIYEVWRDAEGQKYLKEHENRALRVGNSEADAEDDFFKMRAETATKAAGAHRAWLRKLNDYLGVAMPWDNPKNHHSSVCWSCKSSVSSTLNPTCRRCGWLVCSCGACQCNINYVP